MSETCFFIGCEQPVSVEVEGIKACYRHAHELVWWTTRAPWEREGR